MSKILVGGGSAVDGVVFVVVALLFREPFLGGEVVGVGVAVVRLRFRGDVSTTAALALVVMTIRCACFTLIW